MYDKNNNVNRSKSLDDLLKLLKGTTDMSNHSDIDNITPVKYPSQRTAICSEVLENIEYLNDDFSDQDDESPIMTEQLQSKEERDKLLQDNLAKVKFSDQIKIDFIQSIDYRILCRFLGVTSVNDIKNHPFQSHPLITLILMESLDGFMKSQDYEMVGELNFDPHGNSKPPEKNPWNIKGKETTFTTTGFIYFEKIKGDKRDNVVFFVFADLEKGGASITCFSTDTNKSKDIVKNLQTYSKKFNCLRGAKLKDVNMIEASFSEVEITGKYTWDNYYYSKEIKDLFQLEVFDFIKNVEKYNKCNIVKRGIILHGKPGCGKTTIGNIICNMIPDNTVIWITPEILSENNYRAMCSIKALYKLADFLSPCVIILEDLDLFSQDRDRGGDVLSLGALMNILDGVNTITNSVTIGTTNRLSSIEEALKNRPGRFDRIVEIPALSKSLRGKMLRERLKDWKVSKEVLDYTINKTDDWTGAEVQEFINTLNLKHISGKKKNKIMGKKLAEEVIKTLSNFGVGEASSGFGFGEKKKD